MRGGERSVRVFVDDAVQGRFPPVSAATGEPSDGWMTLESRQGGLPSVVWIVLVLVGPAGWGVLFLLWLFSAAPGERLEIELPWTEAVHDETVALHCRRTRAWLVVAAALGGAVVTSVAAASGPRPMAAVVVTAACAAAALVAFGVALVVNVRIGRHTPRVELDASRRWVTLGNVAPAFVRATAADQAARPAPR